jgi:hypothetical protein
VAAQVQQDDVLRLLVFEGVYQCSSKINCFQRCSP